MDDENVRTRAHERDAAMKRQRDLTRAARWMLVRTVEDLRSRADSNDDYVRLGIAAVLRRTLTDQHAVAHVGHDVKSSGPLIFRYSPYTVVPIQQGEAGTLGESVLWLPEPGEFRYPATDSTLKVFRSASIASACGEAITVSDLIKYFAHVEGAVHIGHPESRHEEIMQSVFQFRTLGWKNGLDLLADIAAVTADALERPSEA